MRVCVCACVRVCVRVCESLHQLIGVGCGADEEATGSESLTGVAQHGVGLLPRLE